MGSNLKIFKLPLDVYYRIIGGVIIAAFLAIPLLGNNYWTHIVLEIFFLAYMGQSWNILCGSTGQLSFGHAAFFGVGAYTSSLLLLKWGISPWVGMIAGGLIASLLGIIIGVVSLRLSVKGVFFALATLAVAEVLKLLALFWMSLTNGASGILIHFSGENIGMFSFGVHKKYLYYYVIFLMLAGVTYLSHRIKRVRLGYYLVAIRENEDAAEMLGINSVKYQTVMIALSGFLTAIGGTFYAQYYQYFEPDIVFGTARSFEFIFPVILGGGGNVMGPIIGAFVLQFFEEATRAIIPSTFHGFHRMLYGLLIVVMIMYLPKGIVSLIERKKDEIVSKFKMKSGGK